MLGAEQVGAVGQRVGAAQVAWVVRAGRCRVECQEVPPLRWCGFFPGVVFSIWCPDVGTRTFQHDGGGKKWSALEWESSDCRCLCVLVTFFFA